MPKSCLCVFFGSFLLGEKTHINKIPPKSRDNPVKILFMCFCSLRVFFFFFFRSQTAVHQRSPNPPEFAQPRLSMSNGGHPQREGTSLGVFVPIWLVLPRCEATNLGVFDLCHFALLKRGCANSVGWVWSSLSTVPICTAVSPPFVSQYLPGCKP